MLPGPVGSPSEPEDVFARVPEVAAQTDLVLEELDGLLDDDQLNPEVRADQGKCYRFTMVTWTAFDVGGNDPAHAAMQTSVLEQQLAFYQILEQPLEHEQAAETVRHHQQVCGRAPRLVVGDSGVHSPETEGTLTSAEAATMGQMAWNAGSALG